jgi:YHS domain-containing protein/thioredoxin-related protein
MPQSQPHKRLATVSLALALTSLAQPASPCRAQFEDPGAIPWRPSFEHAVAEARAARRPLLVQFSGPWCSYCRQMEATTLRTPGVVAEARERFVPVEVRNDLREDLAYRYGVTAVPTTLLLGPSGEVLGRHTGYLDPGSMLGLLASARAAYSPPASERLALEGLDPVRLVRTGESAPGRPDLQTSYDGLTYRFADAPAREAFLRDPERYVPSNRGLCLVEQVEEGMRVEGDPRFGVYYKGRMYLCSSEAARRRFARDPSRYADADLACGGNCPHCRSGEGREVQGSPRFAVTHGGRRYLFPDASHRAAFRDDPSRYVH